MDYEHIHHITSADVAIRVKALSAEELFIKAGRALMSEILDDISTLKPVIYVKGEIRACELEMLYFEFLNEFLFYKDARSLLLLPESLNITHDSETYLCTYMLSGENIDRDRHTFKVDIKAVTLHCLRLVQEGNEFIAETVFDV